MYALLMKLQAVVAYPAAEARFSQADVKRPAMMLTAGLLESSSWVCTALCMPSMHRWQRLQGVSSQAPKAVQVSWPVLAAQAQELVVTCLLQNWPPAVLQSLSPMQVPAGFVMLLMG